MTKQGKRAADDRGGADYATLRTRRLATMTDDERQIYDTAYAEAGWAMELADLVYSTRTQAGLTQVELAAAMGTSQSAIAAWENGARTPGIEALERLARACGGKLHITIGAA
jgi:DNA-binding transcriptional regulator YiaG